VMRLVICGCGHLDKMCLGGDIGELEDGERDWGIVC